MKSANKHSWIVILALFAVLACTACVGKADAAKVPGLGVFQQVSRTATTAPKTWESRPFSGEMYVNIYSDGKVLPQHYAGGCRVSYTNGHLFIWVRITECSKPGRHPITARYLNVTGDQPFTLKITRHNPNF